MLPTLCIFGAIGAIVLVLLVMQADTEVKANRLVDSAIAKGRAGDLDGAIAECTQALRVYSKCQKAYAHRGALHGRRRNLDESDSDLTEAIRLDPKDSDSRARRGLTRGLKGDLDGALADFAAASEIAPRDVYPLTCRAWLRLHRREFDLAIADLGEALARRPEDQDLLWKRAHVRVRKGDFDGAYEDANAVVRLHPRSARALFERAMVLYNKGAYPEALTDLYAAAEGDPRAVATFAKRAMVRIRLGDLEGALADLDQAISLGPPSRFLIRQRAMLRTAKGDLEGARADHESALPLFRGDGPPKRRVEQMLAALKEGRPWVIVHASAMVANWAGDAARACPLYEQTIEGLAREDEATRARFGDFEAVVCYDLFCCHALAAAGKWRPHAEEQPLDTAEVERHRTLAFEELAKATALGWDETESTETNRDLSSLHADPRWPTAIEAIRANEAKSRPPLTPPAASSA